MILNIEGVFDVFLNDIEILVYVCFNVVFSFSKYFVKVNLGFNFDFILNYWGSVILDLK